MLMPRARHLVAGAAITAAALLLLLIPGQGHAAGTLRVSKIWYDSPGSDTGTNASLNADWVQAAKGTTATVSRKGWTLTDAACHTVPTSPWSPARPSP
ncbi:hypothetical protein OTB20_23275 [Streptomyces sp. H27-H1]|uniref:hypothetical protein n=1 Tax=Streptomyces sp. H27-H1 TaxID=2996461 RepID=UPI00226DB318|nr:hypothetical protein [Streptomyces sp. H27-H1]MCY0929067.1 hypothetical protein [Streptomyces sp. H27-H1]